MRDALRRNWVLYLIEGWGLGTLLFVTGLQAAALELASTLAERLSDFLGDARDKCGHHRRDDRCTRVFAMGRPIRGAFNSALTIAFGFLRKIRFWDAFFYILAQFGGAAIDSPWRSKLPATL